MRYNKGPLLSTRLDLESLRATIYKQRLLDSSPFTTTTTYLLPPKIVSPGTFTHGRSQQRKRLIEHLIARGVGQTHHDDEVEYMYMLMS